jgi:hypothetical protein
LTQRVRGIILDEDYKMSLIGVNVILMDSNTITGTPIDENGSLKLGTILTLIGALFNGTN